MDNHPVLESKILSSSNQKNGGTTGKQDILCKGLSKALVFSRLNTVLIRFRSRTRHGKICEVMEFISEPSRHLFSLLLCLIPWLFFHAAACHLTPAGVMNSIRCGLIKAKALPSPRASYILKGDSGRNKALRQKRMHLQEWNEWVLGLIF